MAMIDTGGKAMLSVDEEKSRAGVRG